MRQAPIQLGLTEASSAPVDYTASLLRLVDRLLQLLGSGAIPSESIDTRGFRRTIEKFRQALPGVTESRALGDLTAECLETCEQFHQQAHAYLADRESDLLDMIQLLRTTVATISRGSLGYEQQIQASTERLTHAARLDDLTELKCAIQEEVESIRRMTTERREMEAGAFRRLTDRVAGLEAQLSETQDQGAIDPLTGIPNRGAFERILRRHLREAQAGQTFVLALLDLDDFKRINDTHGLLVGDRVLLCVAQHLTETLAPDDVARFGEDEFAILMADISLNQARKRLTEARNRLARSYRYEVEGKSVQIGFTYSGGMTGYSDGDNADTILRRADEALADAKRRSTNRIVTRRHSVLRRLLHSSKGHRD